MAHPTVKFPRADKHPADLAHKQLEVEKAGVIVGFLVGVLLAIGPVSEMLMSAGASSFVNGLGMAVTIAVSARLGLSVGAKLASLIGARGRV